MHTIIRRPVVTVLLLCAVASSAAAHKPVSIGGVFPSHEEALAVTEIDVSQVIYSPLDEEHRALWVTFEASEETTFAVSLGIPALERLADYRPLLAVVGPGLPEPTLDVALPANSGGVVFDAATGEPRFFHEPFTGTDSWILLEETVTLPETGTYYVVAWPPGDQVDKLWIAIGTREQFGFSDFLAFPSMIRDVRAFHEVSGESNGTRIARRVLFFACAVTLGILLLARTR